MAVNDAAIAKYGYTNAEFLSMTLRDIRHSGADRQLLEDHLSGWAPRNQIADVWQHRTKDGSVIDVEISSATAQRASSLPMT